MPLPIFSTIQPKILLENLKSLLAENRRALTQLLATLSTTPPSWDVVQQLENLEEQLTLFWAPIRHLQAVCETPELRKAYQAGLPLLTHWHAELEQNTQLYQAVAQLHENPELNWEPAQKTLIKNMLKSFRLAGVALDVEARTQYRQFQARLAECSAQFESNILDASDAGALLITNANDLIGLSQQVLSIAKKAANDRKLSGWLLTLDAPCYHAVLTTADSTALRQKMYRAWVTRASEQGNDPQFDNSALMLEILSRRQSLSQILGFQNAVELSLATDKMAQSPQAVLDFLEQLITKTRSKAHEEFNHLQQFATKQGFLSSLNPWDIAYWSEKLKAKTLGFNETALRAYFPLPQVLTELFTLLTKIFKITIVPFISEEIWRPDVQIFLVRDAMQEELGYFYLDLYARPYKHEGAWVDGCQQRRRLDRGTLQLPIAFVNCNFSPPTESNRPSLLSHEEVTTLFHEMGHCLHHVLTKVDYAGVSGMQGVPWDAVEFPSQLLECFAWEPEVLRLISAHYETNAPLPDHYIQGLQTARTFHAGLQLIRQLEFSLFDFKLHFSFDPSQHHTTIHAILGEVRNHIYHGTSLPPIPTFNRFQHSFSHIFSGGYAAGYYGYLWAEVLAADAFERFKTEGILNDQTGQDFANTILAQGGAVEAIKLFEQFRKRPLESRAFLVQRGIS